MKKYILTIAVLALSVLMFLSCDKIVRPVMVDVPQRNEINIIEKNGIPEKNRKIWVSLVAKDLSPKGHHEWRTRHIPTALKNAGLNSFEVLDPKNQRFDTFEAGGDYLLVIILNNFMAQDRLSEGRSLTDLWLFLTATMYDLPSKRLVVKSGGSATDVVAADNWSSGEMCYSLLEEMMENMYRNG